jgi:hypothetical protein
MSRARKKQQNGGEKLRPAEKFVIKSGLIKRVEIMPDRIGIGQNGKRLTENFFMLGGINPTANKILVKAVKICSNRLPVTAACNLSKVVSIFISSTSGFPSINAQTPEKSIAFLVSAAFFP